jgi:AAA domain-containing protein
MSLPGFKEMIIADAGAGKTHVIRTLLAYGITPYVLATEPGTRSLELCENPGCNVCQKTQEFPQGSIPWAYVDSSAADIDLLIKQADDVNTKTLKMLCNIEDNQRKGYNQFGQVLRLTKEFVDHKGVSHGSPSQWNTDRAFVLDAVTELGYMAMNMYVGRRPVYDKPDYQVAQRMVYNYLHLLTNSLRCHVIVLGHLDKQFNEASGVTTQTVQSVGQKLSPQLPRKFDDVIVAKRVGDKYTWSTAELNSEGKGRNLPTKAGMPQDFGLVVEGWKRAGGVIEPTIIEGESK